MQEKNWQPRVRLSVGMGITDQGAAKRPKGSRSTLAHIALAHLAVHMFGKRSQALLGFLGLSHAGPGVGL